MAKQQLQKLRAERTFKGRQFTTAVILWAVRWYLMFPISYRDLELMLQDRGVEISHTTIFRWIQADAPELEKRLRPHLCKSNGSWRVDETYVRVKGRWAYLYRAVDSCGQTIDFLLTAHRDGTAAKRFFRKALGQPHTVKPRTITVDKNPAYPRAIVEMKAADELWRFAQLRQSKYLNNIVEQDHRCVKRLVRPGLGFGSMRTARRTLAGYEAMAMIRKGQAHQVGGRDMQNQASLVAGLYSALPPDRPQQELSCDPTQTLQQNPLRDADDHRTVPGRLADRGGVVVFDLPELAGDCAVAAGRGLAGEYHSALLEPSGLVQLHGDGRAALFREVGRSPLHWRFEVATSGTWALCSGADGEWRLRLPAFSRCAHGASLPNFRSSTLARTASR